MPFILVDVDYSISVTTITFSAGQTEVLVPVTAIEDAISELTEDFQAVLSNPSTGLVVGDADTATVNIEDNNGVPGSIIH